MKAAFLKFWQLGRLDFAVDLGQRLLAAHRQDRVAEGDEQAEHADQMLSQSARGRCAASCSRRSRSSSGRKPSGSSLVARPSG